MSRILVLFAAIVLIGCGPNREVERLRVAVAEMQATAASEPFQIQRWRESVLDFKAARKLASLTEGQRSAVDKLAISTAVFEAVLQETAYILKGSSQTFGSRKEFAAVQGRLKDDADKALAVLK